MRSYPHPYPLGYKVSHFRQARRLALASGQAAGILWEFLWKPTTAGQICFINRIELCGNQIANATAEELRFNLKVTRGQSTANTTNTASILRSGDMQKLNGAMADSLLFSFRETSSATAATGGNGTPDTDALAIGSYVTLATASTSNDGSADVVFDFQPINDFGYPLRLESGEAFTINLEASKGATTGYVSYLEVQWTECTKVP